ncbi:MAG: hypothetical protein KDC53_09445 [Saprospiraceae bacterium]|nr:hypothetical protein [Saprospiraceae bacterium]
MRLIIILLFLLGYFRALTQNEAEQLVGKISFKNAQNIYVRFENTEGIEPGDTLYLFNNDTLIPGLIVNQLSSISCVTTSLDDVTLNLGELVVFQQKTIPEKSIPVTLESAPVANAPEEPDNELDRERLKEREPHLRGRISIGSYTNFSDARDETTQRMRYTFSLDATNINSSKFSVESYAIFRHTAKRWSEVKENLASALKVYNLAVRYEAGNDTEIILGRKINRHLSNVGAVDGLQVAHTLGNFTVGGIVGSRPDTYDYRPNLHLFEYGGFVSYNKTDHNGQQIQTSMAVLEQKYYSKTDRRFVYLQHSNSIIKSVNVFSSVEFDLYKPQDTRISNKISPTSIFLSVNYRVSRKFSVSSSYDARKNVIYYESYKNFIDRLIEQETRQGARLRFTYRPFKYFTIGSSAGYRFQRDQNNTSKNLYSFINISRIPWFNMSMTISSTLLESNYLEGNIYGVGLTKDLIGGKLFAEANYRKVKYRYGQFGTTLNQQIVSLNLSGRINKQLSISGNIETTLEKNRTLNRIYANLIHRF